MEDKKEYWKDGQPYHPILGDCVVWKNNRFITREYLEVLESDELEKLRFENQILKERLEELEQK